jgi:hypothetical protein
VLIGNWDLATDPPLQMPGLRMRVTIDSARGANFFGRLTFYFSGNVGGDLNAFEPFVGAIDREGNVEFAIERRDPAMLGIGVVGQLVSDTILASTFVIGPDTVTTIADRSWFFVKGR